MSAYLSEEQEAAELQDCPNSKDGRGHCPHWWDGDGCCWCDSGPMSQEEMIKDGMLEGPPNPAAHIQRLRDWRDRQIRSKERTNNNVRRNM